MVGTWLRLKDFADELESKALTYKTFPPHIHFYFQPMLCAVCPPPIERASRLAFGVTDILPHHQLHRPTYGKVKKGSAAQTMCFCCLFLSVLLGWCSPCPTDNVFSS